MKLWLISDTHNGHEHLAIPNGIDVIIHCGDESESGDVYANEMEARAFFDWYDSLDVATKLYVPGNHSIAVEQGLIRAKEYPKIQFLVHRMIEVNGVVLFGTPYTPRFFNWAFMKDREDLDVVWQSIPDAVDILVSHGPPKGVMDVTHDMNSHQPIHVGSLSLTRHVTQRLKPILHAFGHIHDESGIRNFGVIRNSGITFVNCSCCNNTNKLVNHGVVVEVNPITKTVHLLDE